MTKKIIRLNENILKKIVAESVKKVLLEIKNTTRVFPSKDNVFDLAKIPQDILDKNFVYYSPYRLSASCDSRLQVATSGRFICENVDYEGDVDKAIEDITHTFPIDEVYQVSKQKGYHNIVVALLVANRQGNPQIIIESMAQYNLFLSNKKPSTILSDGKHEWIDMRFEPRIQDDVSNEVRERYSVLGHLSPSVNKDSILKNGLFASNNNPVFKYPTPRLHLIEESATDNDIQELANTLYGQARQKNIKGLTPNYILFSIDLKKVPDTTHFYWDVNEKFGLFTDSNIPPKAISIVRTIRAEE